MSKKKNKNTESNSRRDFLKNAALGAGAAVGMGATSAACSVTKPILDVLPELDSSLVESENFDAVVVGAGVSGAYAALRLALVDSSATPVSYSERSSGTPKVKAQPPRASSPIANFLQLKGKTKLDVKLFEYSGRVGGRLLSTPIEGVDAEDSGPLRFAEFGGFRFDRQMKIVWETAEALGLSDEPFYYQELNIEENNIVNVRGDLYTNGNSKSSEAWKSYPNISQTEKNILNAGFDLGNYITDLAFSDTLPSANSNTNLANYRNVASIVEIPASASRPYPSVRITFKSNFNQNEKSPTVVTIPGNANGWSFSYVLYHFAFNSGDWDRVKQIADQYEQAKKKTKITGRPFFDWSWWALKRNYLTQEAVAFLEDDSGYNEEGNAGTVETNIDENYYFSVKSDGTDLGGLTYNNTSSYSEQTAWRHIKEGYSAIPQQLFNQFRKLDEKGINKNSSVDVVKKQLIAFTKTDSATGDFPQYQCLFYARQQGPKLSISGAAALNMYQENLIKANASQPGSKERDESMAVLKQFKLVTCNFLVLALPRRSLELINQNNFFFGSQGVQSLLRNSVHDILAMRMFVAYPKPWWLENSPNNPYNNLPDKNSPLKQSEFYPVGRTRTDLGLRQLYYWCYNRAVPPSSTLIPKGGNYVDMEKPAVMLASYTSGDATRYWRALQDGQPYDHLSGSQTQQAHLFNKASGKPTENLNIRNPQAGGPRHGSLTMGVEAHKQIVMLHDRMADYDGLPLPYYVHFEDWSKDPWGAGWHSWRSGFAKSEQIPRIRKPLDNENVFIIGECYSNVQGWVQGALNAAEAMLQCNFGLPWASWLSVNGIWLGQGTDWVSASTQDPDPNPCLNEDEQFAPDKKPVDE
ncbi:FAD-dependent oxidoreductase [Reichenbachiella sp.]|uniref:FAD-dependent oxidoreductase n=1 Tax=Reichenbachiella sp. TaxID=2184521 RepID=UPI003298001A